MTNKSYKIVQYWLTLIKEGRPDAMWDKIMKDYFKI